MKLKILSIIFLLTTTCYGEAQQDYQPQKVQGRSFDLGYGGPLFGGFGSSYGLSNSYSSSAHSSYNQDLSGYGYGGGYSRYPSYSSYPAYGSYGGLGGYASGYNGYNNGYSGYSGGYGGSNTAYNGYNSGYSGYGGLYG